MRLTTTVTLVLSCLVAAHGGGAADVPGAPPLAGVLENESTLASSPSSINDDPIEATDCECHQGDTIRSTCTRIPSAFAGAAIDRAKLLQATPVSGALGAEIKMADGSPLNLTHAWSDDLYEEMASLLLRHKLLLFRGQDLSPSTQLAMAKKWGPVPTHPLGSRVNASETHNVPQGVVVLENTKGHNREARNDMWHSDVSCVETPAAVNLLFAADYQLPLGVGDTLFANMERAWDLLESDLQERLKTIDVYFSTHRFEGDSPLEPLKVSTGTYHPAVRTHPDTNRDSLYISPTFFDHFKGIDVKEGQKLHGELSQNATTPENTYRHRWMTGDLIIFDNRNTMHYAVFDYEAGQTRTMHSARAVEVQRPFSKHRLPTLANQHE